MAVTSHIPVIPQQTSPIRYTDIGVPGTAISRGEIIEESPAEVAGDKVYVAVGKNVNESKFTLSWAMHNSGVKKICILHVLEPAQMIPCMGTKFPVSRLDEQQVKAYREMERQDMNKLLREYSMICDKAGVRVDVLHIEMESIEKGIVELISKHGITKLVMGAAADKHYSRRMMEPKSKKAIYVRLEAPASCHIWFICKGHLVHTRVSKIERRVTKEAAFLTRPPMTESTRQFSFWRSQSAPKLRTPREWNGTSTKFNLSVNSHFPSCPVDHTANNPIARTENELEPRAVDRPKEDQCQASPSSDGEMKDELYDQLEMAMAEAEKSRREAFEESMRRRRAEKDVGDAFRRAKASESLYAEELRQRKETEEALVRGKEEVEKMKQLVNEAMKELGVALEQKSSLEREISNSEKLVRELQQKMCSAAELVEKYKKERDELQAERDAAVEEMRKKHVEAAAVVPNTIVPQFFSQFSFSEIEEATNNFDDSLKIGEGGYGSIYKGVLRHTEVAIKMLNSDSSQGPSEFQQEVNILSKLRHPNLVTLIGACPEAWILVYEFAPNGSLEDRLRCKDNTPPLSWPTRIRIASELCSVLIFLHYCTPHGIIHGDLKPSNILLAGNYETKLSDFGISRVISQDQFSGNNNNTTMCCRTVPKGTVPYTDPEFLGTGELTPKSDVYSFGIVLLRLLTGRAAVGLTKEVQYAIEKGNLKDLLDPTAGEWPFEHAEQLTHLAMRCCEMNRRNRPELASDVWRMLEPMRISCGTSSFSEETACQVPPNFICPISQEIMKDPYVAGDEFTYELKAFRGLIDSGGRDDTSPTTNLKLPHCNIRSAIQEWLKRS